MVLKKDKEDKLTVVPSERSGILPRRPFDLRSDIDRIFDRFRAEFDDLLWPWRHREPVTAMTESRVPLMDVADLGDRYEMRLEMPGIPKEDINIEVTPNSIEISAEHDESKEDKGKNWLRRERSSMSFYRSIELPEELKTDEVDAELKNGVLTVMLPKVKPTPKQKARKVKIK